MNRHEGVSCNHCSKVNFTGKRYKCLRCFDYDLCSVCYIANASGNGHTPKHPLQCIICRSDYDLYYGGETITSTGIPQSLTCPYCAQMGFTEVTLKEHVIDKHQGITFQIICPICASSPVGDPNCMITDLSSHLSMTHNIDTRRRISFNIAEQLHPRVASLSSTVRQRPNLQVIPAVRSIQPQGPIIIGHEPLPSASSSPRESTDPIDELIMQISRMRRLNHDNSAALLEHRARCSTLQAMRAEITARQQSVRPNLYVIQSAINVDTPEIPRQEPVPSVPGFSALLPTISDGNLSDTKEVETTEERAEFVKQLLYSTIFCKGQEDENKNSNI